MTKDNTREWPSFNDILGELNSLGPRTAPDPALAHYRRKAEAGLVVDDPIDISTAELDSLASTVVAEPEPVASTETVDASLTEPAAVVEVTPAPPTKSFTFDDAELLPEELAPAEIDTSALEATITPADTSDLDEFDMSALDPVEVATLEPLEPLEALIAPVQDVSAPAPAIDAAAPVELAENPFSTPDIDIPAAAPLPTAGYDPLSGEIDWASTEWGDETPAEPSTGLMDFDTSFELSTNIAEPDVDPSPAVEAAEPITPIETVPTAVEPDGLPAWSSAVDPVDPPTSFDSVATANQIENDLQELFELDQVSEENNVVPLHPSSDDHSEDVVGLDTLFDQDSSEDTLQEWVGVEPEDLRPADPWAHMRPDEAAEVKGGFFGRKGKFWGGDDRRKARVERDAASDQSSSEAEVADGPPCPNCEAPGHVDLNDPVGGKQHLSCSSCDQVWAIRLDQSA